jgi:hypothetical protein
LGLVDLERDALGQEEHRKLRLGAFRDREELILTIGDYIDRHDDNPKPLIWTARASDTLEKVNALVAPWINVNPNDARH